MIKVVNVFLLGICFLLSTVGVASANQEKCLDEACFPVEVNSLQLRGLALFEYLRFDVCTGAFYQDGKLESLADVKLDTAKALELFYHRDISSEDLVEGTRDALEKNPNFNSKLYPKQLQKLSLIHI